MLAFKKEHHELQQHFRAYTRYMPHRKQPKLSVCARSSSSDFIGGGGPIHGPSTPPFSTPTSQHLPLSGAGAGGVQAVASYSANRARSLATSSGWALATARAGNRREGRLNALRAHTNAPAVQNLFP